MSLGVNEMSKLTIDAQIHDLEYQAQNISQRKLAISQQLEQNAKEYEAKTSNRQMKIGVFLSATGTDMGYTITSSTENLTYAAMVASCGDQTEYTGIQASKRAGTADRAYTTSTTYLRLVDADGAIVVSDASEIPGVFIHEKDNTISPENNANTELSKCIDENKLTGDNLTYDSQHGVVKVEYKKTTGTGDDAKEETVVEYYKLDGGKLETTEGDSEIENNKFNPDDFKRAKISGLNENNPIYNVEVVKDDHGNPTFKITKTEQKKEEVYVKINNQLVKPSELEGVDGKFELVDKEGAPVSDFPLYKVDTMLKTGNSETSDSSGGINYFQDCIRNGKYLIQQGSMNPDTSTFQWKNASWDSLTIINDNYYTDDDDTAKAKYDRIQSQLNAQEKKLDLELDTIETQRSALTQEKESLDKCIEDAMDSFKTFA